MERRHDAVDTREYVEKHLGVYQDDSSNVSPVFVIHYRNALFLRSTHITGCIVPCWRKATLLRWNHCVAAGITSLHCAADARPHHCVEITLLLWPHHYLVTSLRCVVDSHHWWFCRSRETRSTTQHCFGEWCPIATELWKKAWSKAGRLPPVIRLCLWI